MKKTLITGIAVLFLATGTAHANEEYYVQCGNPKLIRVWGHHGFEMGYVIGKRYIPLPSRAFRFDRKGDQYFLYFHNRKCVCAPDQLAGTPCELGD